MRIRHAIVSPLALCGAAVFLALCPASLLAQNLTGHYDNWIVMADDTMALALTTDGEDTAFGLICGPECYFYIESRIACIEGRAYRAKIEAGSASRSALMTCKSANGGPLLVMPQDEQLLTLIAKQVDVRFAIIRDRGETSIFRFPLAGSGPAIGMALAARAYIKPLDAAGFTPIAGSPEPDKPK